MQNKSFRIDTAVSNTICGRNNYWLHKKGQKENSLHSNIVCMLGSFEVSVCFEFFKLIDNAVNHTTADITLLCANLHANYNL